PVSESVQGNFLLQQLRSVSSQARRHSLQRRRRQERIQDGPCSHIKWFRTCRRTHPRCNPGKLSTAGRLGGHSSCPTAVYGRRGTHHESVEFPKVSLHGCY